MKKTISSWDERSLQAVWHPCTQMKFHEGFAPVVIKEARGVKLFDEAGNSYIDAISSWWVNLFGHQNERIKQAVIEQLNQVEHVMLAGFSHKPVIELSERLSAKTNYQLGHAFYASDGASATEIALKMSVHYWRNKGFPHKHQFLALKNSYHGETMGALGVTDIDLFKQAYQDLIHIAPLLPVPYSHEAHEIEQCLAVAQTYLEEHHQQLSSMIVEPLVQAAAGMLFYPKQYLAGLSQLAKAYQVHLIVDEIAMGFGRTGSFFAYQQSTAQPDFICLSKGITGGFLPLSAVLTTEEVYQEFYSHDIAHGFLHSHSYTGNPLACRAALEVLNIFDEERVLQTNQSRLELLNQLVLPLVHHPRVNSWRQLGMIWVFSIDTQNPSFARECYQLGLRHHILIRPIGNQLYFMPPYTITDEEFIELVTGTLCVLNGVSG
ncbi:MAG: adenosylmethionine--8-amino-7-oxononanoate transaminase [Ferrovum sp. 37-45-19]|uniref:adenosylmethionine--8-amino-7-oxononanoate transaminase n=1 Tax=Ferrovum sp. JA12 TaxID=1356299 RepID=UPI00070377F8|nr:adenosylmethionine--8-amino-7-oxononanoate transaminase [Ferrovum sp. JA12]OYV79136.1 MAG: adenosylmethionine--8-amino-7-oxononanoate transaminase [Ferrovum sp. 21-44-67]OYV93734.1 MAG: adenosylmethionine--8-amino-7-oxononanoate transaminase [Ferrovum sp. 37-45-19]OZB32265.1 MAG: adenosylmethionine--8-amino-7-oxononanoate transaminase [Ferrovum sp. 34-44-207]HQT81340.1 adenosylmethionine--8-amino-7-oxononanoate transaminase [Ferrovaceae bacterium]KRH78566.1 adenosylmethionine-8-amino-7-oxon